MKTNILRGSGGLNTESDPVRSGYDPEIGVGDLAACSNIDISDRRRISRRKGFTRKLTGNVHSLTAVNNQYCIFCVEDALCRLESSLVDYTPIATVTPNSPMSVVILDNKVYWVNRYEKGVVIDGINQEWTATPLVSSNKTRVFADPPLGSLLAYHNGVMYVVDGKTIWHSEPYAPDHFVKADSFLSFESDVQMIRPVEAGIYISDAYRVWFLRGNTPRELGWNTVDDAPAFSHSDAELHGNFILDQAGLPILRGSAKAAVWLTKKGVCYGGSDGTIIQLTERKIDLPGQYTSGACLVNGATLISQFN